MSSDVETPYAGERLAEATLTCPACGRTAQHDAAFCAFCGTGLAPQRVPGYPVFAAIAAAITGKTAYDVLGRVGGLFEELGAVFEGVPEAPGTLVALFPPTEEAATVAARAALRARAQAPEVRLGLDASEVTERSDQDATWQFLIDRGVRLQSMAHDGEVVAGETLPALTEGAAVVEPLDPAGGPVLLRTVRDLAPIEAPQPIAEAAAPDRVEAPAPRRSRRRRPHPRLQPPASTTQISSNASTTFGGVTAASRWSGRRGPARANSSGPSPRGIPARPSWSTGRSPSRGRGRSPRWSKRSSVRRISDRRRRRAAAIRGTRSSGSWPARPIATAS